MLIGGNIGKNKATANDDAWKDYFYCFTRLYNEVDYFVVNVSSPNTPGLRELQESASLSKIFTPLLEFRNQQVVKKPVFLKIAPDLSAEQVDEVVTFADSIRLEGLILSNTTISRENLKTPASETDKIGAGGLSGKPLAMRANELLQYVKARAGKDLLLISSGGIFDKADVNERINSGASLVQVWTGFIYEGPGIVKKLLDTK